MAKRTRGLLEQALDLPMSERAKLAQELFDSLDDEHAGEPELDGDYHAELARRAEQSPPKGNRWPTAREVVDRIAADLQKPGRKPRKRERGA